jgi:hypothetical protein
MDVTYVLCRWCICCSGYTRMLQVHVPNISPVPDYVASVFIWTLHMLQLLDTYDANVCFSLQWVLLPTRSNSRTSTRCTKRPCTTRYGPPRWSMQSAQHMCMRAMISLSLSLYVVCSQGVSRISACALCSPSRMRIRVVFSLACSWTGPHTCSSGRRSRRRRRVAQ